MDNTNIPNQASQTPPAPMGGNPVNPIMNQNFDGGAQKSSMGPIIGSIIVVLVIVLGGLYLYGQQIGEKTLDEVTPEEISAAIDQATIALTQQGATDDLAEIDADLSATDLNALAAELDSIEQELSL